jgi:inorganic pyrophosphatase
LHETDWQAYEAIHSQEIAAMPSHPIHRLPPFDTESGDWLAVIETPKLRHYKYKFDSKREVFFLDGVLPEGMSFPYDFGFLPSTLGEDGDPIDVLVLSDQPTFCGCVVPARLIGVIEAEQTEVDGTRSRNDRLLAVPVKAANFAAIRSIDDLDKHRLEEIQQFFISYNRVRGKQFKVLGIRGPDRADVLAKEAIKRFKKPRRKSSGKNNRSSKR